MSLRKTTSADGSLPHMATRTRPAGLYRSAAGTESETEARANKKEAVGVIGLGIMGGAFARTSSPPAGGSSAATSSLPGARRRGRPASRSWPTPGGLAEAASDIITSLPTPGAVRETAQAIIAAAQTQGRTVIETSTLALADKSEVQRSAPGGRPHGAGLPDLRHRRAGEGEGLVVYASGDAAAIKRLESAVPGFARKVHDLGAFGNGSKMKFVANHLVAIHNVAAAEAMVLGMKAGLDPHRIVEVVRSGAGTSRVFELRAPMMAKTTTSPPPCARSGRRT